MTPEPMKKLECARCQNPFYSASSEEKMPCPYCGHTFGKVYEDRRGRTRDLTHRACDISKGEMKVPVKVTDLSQGGVGIRMKGYLPFEEDDAVKVFIKELDMEKDARVVWARKVYGISKAGLAFMVSN
ncbi:MAG: PilZ domain-containing protein [Thermodesulfobacteriota bacterium]